MTGPPRELTRSERAAIRRLVTGLCANYDEREKLCLPLDCPCYMLHKWWTGQRQKKCPVCGKLYLPTTSQAYCSDACRTWARRDTDKKRKRRIRQHKG